MDHKKLIDAVNRSGFPLQIKTAALVEQFTNTHGWKVRYSEHSWRSNEDDGFIDLVLEDRHGTGVLVVECKRVLNASWIFLAPDTKASSRRYCKCWVTQYTENKFHYFDWHEMTADPATPQSAYCIVDGEDPKSKPMLERTAAEVIAATEAIAAEEREILIKKKDFQRSYFGVIITTASLKICTFEPNAISISNGMISDANIVDVPYLRFHKQLSTTAARNDNTSFETSNLDNLTNAKERTIFVVNSEHLTQFLTDFNWDKDSIEYLR